MPLYIYQCPLCKEKKELLVSHYGSNPKEAYCDNCSEIMKKIPSVSGDMSKNWEKWRVGDGGYG